MLANNNIITLGQQTRQKEIVILLIDFLAN